MAVLVVRLTGSVESVLLTLTTSTVRKLGDDSCPNFMLVYSNGNDLLVCEFMWMAGMCKSSVSGIALIVLFLDLGSDLSCTIDCGVLYGSGVKHREGTVLRVTYEVPGCDNNGWRIRAT